MIPKECKRLAEVDFPVAVVSKHAAREKSIRHGHPSTLHLWWARRPLAACRAVLLGLLLPDPCDSLCPAEFKEKARELLATVQGQVGDKDEDLRRALLKFIGDFANWDLSAHLLFLDTARSLVKAAHPHETPLLVDSFAGGGSIPLEGLRLGCEVFATDLNPVSCLILKFLLEDTPRHRPELAEELRRAGAEIKKMAEKELAEFYPPDPDGAKPIAYLWARTVRCEAPDCGAEIPLLRSFWLCKKPHRRRALKYEVVRSSSDLPNLEFDIFEPKSDREVPGATVTRAKATCLCCNTTLSADRVRAQLRERTGGADVIFDEKGNRRGGSRLLAVVMLKPEEQRRLYRLPTERDYKAVLQAMKQLQERATKPIATGLNPVPDEPTPSGGGSGAGRAFSVQKYGMMTFGDLFTARQKLALTKFVDLIALKASTSVLKYVLALTLSHVIDRSASLCRWRPQPYMETVESVYGRQALPIVWDFAEAVLLSDSTGSFSHALAVVSQCVEAACGTFNNSGQVEIADACSVPLPDFSATIWFTDPPYYDAVPYADLSDFFFVWLKRTLPGHSVLRDPFHPENPLTPKTLEIVQDETKQVNGRPKDRTFFEEAMGQAFAEGRRVLQDKGIGCVVFAHKTTDGWEALLAAMIRGGWVITGSWPIATEMGTRLRARESAALATSIHLVCRPRADNAPIGDWSEILRKLPKHVGEWMERLQGEGIRGADLVFACIGPALEIFSRYSKVETAEGREVKLPDFLEKVWEVVGRTALEQVLGTAESKARNTTAGALEEDARLTALFLWTIQSTNGADADGTDDATDEETEEDEQEEASRGKKAGFSLMFDVVRRFVQPLGIHLPDWEGRTVETKKGVVRLLPVTERAQQLFGIDGAQAVADRLERSPVGTPQLTLFSEGTKGTPPTGGGRRKKASKVSDEALRTRREATTLDRIHAAMLLQASGRANALRALLRAEQERGPDFLRLANALSALYPKGSEEKRLLDAMLLAVTK